MITQIRKSFNENILVAINRVNLRETSSSYEPETSKAPINLALARVLVPEEKAGRTYMIENGRVA